MANFKKRVEKDAFGNKQVKVFKDGIPIESFSADNPVLEDVKGAKLAADEFIKGREAKDDDDDGGVFGNDDDLLF